MTTFITPMSDGGTGPRLAVKDLIDVVGVPTTAGCRALPHGEQAATNDAACMAGARAADARVVGKANLTELAMTGGGINAWYGTPVNPLDPALMPGGSSSGSAAAVGSDEADVAFGSDTGGSVRIPSACCGTTGLKTTFGRVPLDGVWPLCASLDTVGPMARDIAGVELGMQLLEPGFVRAGDAATVIGRIATPDADPIINRAVDDALRMAGFEIVELDVPEFHEIIDPFVTIYLVEGWQSDRRLVETRPEGVGEECRNMIALGPGFQPMYRAAQAQVADLGAALISLLDRVQLLALPTLPVLAPRLDGSDYEADASLKLGAFTPQANVTGLPALALPVPTASDPLPASLQLIGPRFAEDLLVTTGAVVEAAIG
jgi:amidase